MYYVLTDYKQRRFKTMSFNSTLFSNTLAQIPRHIFQKLERRHKVGRSSRKFGFKEQFTFLAFFQLASQKSMRSTVRCLQSLGKKLYHFGLSTVSLSTISEANKSRPVAFFQELFAEMYHLCEPVAPKHKFRFKSKLFSMDASIIKLSLLLFPWANYQGQQGAVKLHAVIDHKGHIPCFVDITKGNVNERKIAKCVELPENSIVTFDKGYNSYKWFQQLSEKSIFFVTRITQSAKYKIIERKKINKKQNITFDQIIEVKVDKNVLHLRHVGYYDEENDKYYEYITNRFDLSAKTIALIYKERWKIELFFKEIKQNLKIKKFVGNSENAVLIQIYTSLTVYLLLAYHKFLSKSKLSIQKLLELLTLKLLEPIYLQDCLSPQHLRPQKNKNTYHFSLLEIVA